MTPPHDPPMWSELSRLISYTNWPCRYMDVKHLANAGFHYINRDDVVRCAFCLIEVGYWERGDCPYSNHRSLSPNCPLVLGRNCGNIPINPDSDPFLFGRDLDGARSVSPTSLRYDYGIEIRPNSLPERGFSPTPPATSHENLCNKFKNVCVVCLDSVIEVTFLPCGHTSCCIKCSNALTKCPMCRNILRAVVRIYLP